MTERLNNIMKPSAKAASPGRRPRAPAVGVSAHATFHALSALTVGLLSQAKKNTSKKSHHFVL